MSAAKEWREEGRKQGLEQGLEKGRKETINQTAINMLRDGLPLEKISQYTGLTLRQLKLLKNNLG